MNNKLTIELSDWPANVPVTEIQNPSSELYKELVVPCVKAFNARGIELGALAFDVHGKSITTPAKNTITAGR